MNELYGVNTNLRTVAEIQRALRTKALDIPAGRWLRGLMFDDTKVVDAPCTGSTWTKRCPTIR